MDTMKRVLIMDDEYEMVEHLSRMLKKQGYETIVASDGEEGLEIIKHQKVDVIITDIVMGGMDGYKLCQELRESDLLSDIPVVVCTAYANKERLFRKIGVDDYLIKPFSFETLSHCLERIFSQLSHHIKYKKILVQTDDLSSIKATTDQMKRFGFRIDITTISESDSIIEESLKIQPDIIILNALQEAVEADKLIKSLKRYVELKDVDIIFYLDMMHKSGRKRGKEFSLEDLKARCFNSGAVDCMMSLDKESFLNVLLEYCKVKKNVKNKINN